MATGLIVPVLLAKKMTHDEEFTEVIQSVFGSFGIAWRLLDDVQDIKTDIKKGIHSSIYICLSEEVKKLWDKNSAEKADKNFASTRAILSYILENNVIEIIKERICRELESAASIADGYDMKGWADELRCLLRPLKNWQDRL
jgi:geranylgeranyl pyrophosphate synthase